MPVKASQSPRPYYVSPFWSVSVALSQLSQPHDLKRTNEAMSAHVEEGTSWQPPRNWRERPICVLGAGLLGRRIAACFVAAGYHLRVQDPIAEVRNDAVNYIRANISAFTALSQRQPGTCEAVQDLPGAVKDCWLVFEAVPEILNLKQDTFAELEKSAPNDCILGSNSSSFKSSELIGKLKSETKGRVLNTHFMIPPEVG